MRSISANECCFSGRVHQGVIELALRTTSKMHTFPFETAGSNFEIIISRCGKTGHQWFWIKNLTRIWDELLI